MLIIGLLAIAVFIYVALCVHRNSVRGKGFEAVNKGMSETEVIASMGEPDDVRTTCGDRPTWLDQPVIGESCTVEFQYDAGLSAFWTVGFNSEGKAIAKYLYVSP